ncbi:MAG: mannonate dehydratase [Candidatus Latescibacterota bacterium]|nr:mannonate dehydratase [Candidatus Latescibacterota bacterium]
MHVGTQQWTTTDEDLEFLARHGVTAKNENFITFDREIGWDVKELIEKKEKCAKFGIEMEMVAIPISSLNCHGGQVPNYMLGNREEGDKEIELVCNMIRQAAEAGIPAIKYYLCEMENQRTPSDPPGRGNSSYSTWDIEKADDSQRYDEPVTAEMNWERITYYLERVVPVAEECKVRMACHPCDPWLPPGFRGVDRVMGGPDGFRKFITICESDYHGLNLCLGCMAEATPDSPNDVPAIIREFGSQNKIFLCHFRNIIGGPNKFQEVWPDEGVMSMYQNMQALNEVGYPHMVVPDHGPGHSEPGAHRQAWAYQWGYIKAMIQAVQENARQAAA